MLDVLLQLPRQLISFKFSDARKFVFTHCLAVKVRAADLKSVTSTMEASKLLVCTLKSARLLNLLLCLEWWQDCDKEFLASGMQFRSFLLAFAGVTAASCVPWP